MEEGLFKGEKCNRNGCNGIIDAYEKDGCCSCHIDAPCSYCTTQTEYCPVCGWSAEEEQRKYDKIQHELYLKNPPKYQIYKSDKERYDNLKDGEFGYIYVASGGHTICRVKGKHNNMSIGDIYKKIGVYENPNMPRMKYFTNNEFELIYFCD